ncbi:CatA-like O-acetyltransferase [Lacticaseibacillus manihotivorans]
MPLSITANHAVADGYHVTNLLNQLQHAFNQHLGLTRQAASEAYI